MNARCLRRIDPQRARAFVTRQMAVAAILWAGAGGFSGGLYLVSARCMAQSQSRPDIGLRDAEGSGLRRVALFDSIQFKQVLLVERGEVIWAVDSRGYLARFRIADGTESQHTGLEFELVPQEDSWMEDPAQRPQMFNPDRLLWADGERAVCLWSGAVVECRFVDRGKLSVRCLFSNLGEDITGIVITEDGRTAVWFQREDVTAFWRSVVCRDWKRLDYPDSLLRANSASPVRFSLSASGNSAVVWNGSVVSLFDLTQGGFPIQSFAPTSGRSHFGSFLAASGRYMITPGAKTVEVVNLLTGQTREFFTPDRVFGVNLLEGRHHWLIVANVSELRVFPLDGNRDSIRVQRPLEVFASPEVVTGRGTNRFVVVGGQERKALVLELVDPPEQ